MFRSFKNALNGIRISVIQGRNFKIMLVFFALVVALGIIVNLSMIEWAIVLVCCAGVIASEIINTAIENAVDLCTKEYNVLAKNAKDAAAGASLVICIFSAAIGLIIFIPQIIELFKG